MSIKKKNKPTLDAKAWGDIWEKYSNWLHESGIVMGISLPELQEIQRIVNAELRRLSDGKKKEN